MLDMNNVADAIHVSSGAILEIVNITVSLCFLLTPLAHESSIACGGRTTPCSVMQAYVGRCSHCRAADPMHTPLPSRQVRLSPNTANHGLCSCSDNPF